MFYILWQAASQDGPVSTPVLAGRKGVSKPQSTREQIPANRSGNNLPCSLRCSRTTQETLNTATTNTIKTHEKTFKSMPGTQDKIVQGLYAILTHSGPRPGLHAGTTGQLVLQRWEHLPVCGIYTQTTLGLLLDPHSLSCLRQPLVLHSAQTQVRNTPLFSL
jgi:hypothetical protein